MTFDFSFAPGETGEDVEGKAKSHFTIAPGDLYVSFRERENMK